MHVDYFVRKVAVPDTVEDVKMSISSLMFMVAEAAVSATEVTEEAGQTLNDYVSNYGVKEYLFTGAGMLILMVVFAAPLFLAVIPARIAKNKGRNFGGYYVFGYFALIPAIIVALVLKPVEVKEVKEKSMAEIIKGKKGK